MVKRKRLTVKQLKLVSGIANGKSATQAALEAGYGRGVNANSAKVQASRELRNPNVLGALERAFDKAGVSLDASALVVAEAHRAKIGTTALPDHHVRLKAAELNLRARRLLLPREGEGAGGNINIGGLLAIIKSSREERGLPL